MTYHFYWAVGEGKGRGEGVEGGRNRFLCCLRCTFQTVERFLTDTLRRSSCGCSNACCVTSGRVVPDSQGSVADAPSPYPHLSQRVSSARVSFIEICCFAVSDPERALDMSTFTEVWERTSGVQTQSPAALWVLPWGTTLYWKTPLGWTEITVWDATAIAWLLPSQLPPFFYHMLFWLLREMLSASKTQT